jgi:hypothetical protein
VSTAFPDAGAAPRLRSTGEVLFPARVGSGTAPRRHGIAPVRSVVPPRDTAQRSAQTASRQHTSLSPPRLEEPPAASHYGAAAGRPMQPAPMRGDDRPSLANGRSAAPAPSPAPAHSPIPAPAQPQLGNTHVPPGAVPRGARPPGRLPVPRSETAASAADAGGGGGGLLDLPGNIYDQLSGASGASPARAPPARAHPVVWVRAPGAGGGAASGARAARGGAGAMGGCDEDIFDRCIAPPPLPGAPGALAGAVERRRDGGTGSLGRKAPSCSVCGAHGHNRTRCPQVAPRTRAPKNGGKEGRDVST